MSDSKITSTARTVARFALGAALLRAGIGHLTTERREFQAQVPDWFPAPKDAVVVGSGVVEVAQGAALIALPQWKRQIGVIVAAFFVAVFPGNIHQYRAGIDAFTLDTDRKRAIRLIFQPVLVWWALASTR